MHLDPHPPLRAVSSEELDGLLWVVLSGCEFSLSTFSFDRLQQIARFPLEWPEERRAQSPDRLEFRSIASVAISDSAKIDTYALEDIEYLEDGTWRISAVPELTMTLRASRLDVALM